MGSRQAAAAAVAALAFGVVLSGCAWFAAPVSAPGCPAWLKPIQTSVNDVLTVGTEGQIVALNEKVDRLCK